MAIKISGTTVIDDNRDITNIIDMTVSGNAIFSSTSAMNIPSGTTAQRPVSPSTADFRWNTDEGQAELWDGVEWTSVGGGGLTVTTANTSGTSAQVIGTYDTTNVLSAKYLILATDPATTDRYITELLVAHDGANVVSTEYGQLATNSQLMTLSVGINAGNVDITATPTVSALDISIQEILFVPQ